MSDNYSEFFKAATSARNGEGRRSGSNPKRKRPKVRKDLPRSENVSSKPVQKARRKRVEFPLQSLIFIVFGLSVATVGYLNPDICDDYLSRIEVGVFGKANAGEAAKEKTSETKEQSRAKPSVASDSTNSDENSKSAKQSAEDLSHFSKLYERKKELDRREAELNDLEKELHKQKADIETRIKKLEKLRVQISKILKQRVDVDQKKVARLVDFYSNMKPQQAAKIIGTLNEDLAIEILGKMKKKNAAEIMNLLTPEKAQTLTEMFAGYQRK